MMKEVTVVFGVDSEGKRMPEKVFESWEEAEAWRDEQDDVLSYGLVTCPYRSEHD